MTPPKYYITTAIDYINGVPHLGHAYEKIGADVLRRYKRMTGHETWLVVGSDEHSQSVEKEAAAKGMTPEAYCESMLPRWHSMYERLQIDYTEFVRTSSDANRATTEEFLQRVYDNGHIYKGKYAGYFCPSCEQYYQERELLEGKCPEHGITLDWVEEENYFLKLSAFTDQLIELHQREDFLQPESRRNEMLNVIREGLPDVSISRGFTTWGFPLPFDRIAGHLCLVRRPAGLRHRRRLWHGQGALQPTLAVRRAHHRQGHHPLPHHHVAGDAVGRRALSCPAGCIRPRLHQRRRREDEQVQRHLRGAAQAGRQPPAARRGRPAS